jgi:hypothetical protein
MEGGTGVYMREGTTSRVMVADRPYGEFYDFYSVSPEYFGLTSSTCSLPLVLTMETVDNNGLLAVTLNKYHY